MQNKDTAPAGAHRRRSMMRLSCIGFLFVLAVHGRLMAQTFSVLHSFTTVDSNTSTNVDGSYPWTGLVLSGNTLYGTTVQGGFSAEGTVFRVNVDGTGFTNLHSFSALTGPPLEIGTNFDGAKPQGKLVLSGDALYGTTSTGGPLKWGTIFSVNIDGTGFTDVHTFASQPSDGSFCYAGMLLSDNTLYGATSAGGNQNDGAIFAVDPGGTNFINIYNFGNAFGSDITLGFQPQADLALSGQTLYGTAPHGGESNGSGFGTVFALQTDGTGYRNIHTFAGDTNGDTPEGGLVCSGNVLFGTTADNLTGTDSTYGRVFAVNTDGTGYTVLHSFTANDGREPTASLILVANTLYGTTRFGGPSNDGVLFSVNTDGTGFAILHAFAFAVADGAQPTGSLLFSNNILYGTTTFGGQYGSGTVFSFSLGVGLPQLNFSQLAGNLVISWPANVTGLSLQSTANLGPSAVWTPVLTVPVVVNGQNVVTSLISGPQQFFRLSQ